MCYRFRAKRKLPQITSDAGGQIPREQITLNTLGEGNIKETREKKKDGKVGSGELEAGIINEEGCLHKLCDYATMRLCGMATWREGEWEKRKKEGWKVGRG